MLAVAQRELPRVAPLMRDRGVPLWMKLAALLAIVFVISPLNILGDVPLLGFLDDAALIALVLHQFVRLAERAGSPRPVGRSVSL